MTHEEAALCERLKYAFRDERLLKTALTHPSYAGEHKSNHYQRLEFLGDAVLELAVSDELYRRMSRVDEGKLTRIRAATVCESSLSQAARRLDLGPLIRLSVGEERTGGRRKPSILSDVLEAIFGAIYLDGGFEAARTAIRVALAEALTDRSLSDPLDAKSRLQESMQQHGHMPTYALVDVQGPPHAPMFRYEARDGDVTIGAGEGTSKQAAQQAAAQDALLHYQEYIKGA